MDYTINEIDEELQHVIVTWTDVSGKLHDHERVAGLFNTAVELPNTEFRGPLMANPDYKPEWIVNPRLLDPEVEFDHSVEQLMIPNPEHDPEIQPTVPNPEHDPSNPLHTEPTLLEIHTTPESIRAELEAFMQRYNDGLTAQQEVAEPVTIVRVQESLASLVQGA